MKKAFTLVELLVVIAIIGILSGVLLGTFSGGTASAKEAKCLTNLRALAQACQSYGTTSWCFPCAGSVEWFTISEARGQSQAEKRYGEYPGWISWNSQGAYKNSPKSHQSSASWYISAYDSDKEARDYALTNGVLWKYTGGSRSCYCCSLHQQKMKTKAGGDGPAWSYVMNAFFLWDYTQGKRAFFYTDLTDHMRIGFSSLARSDRRLLFAELQFLNDAKQDLTAEEDEGSKTDCVLQYKGCKGGSSPESIGFNHKVGKNTYANVVFADGHVEKLVFPKDGMSETERQELTMWLCTGLDVSFDGKRYEKMDN